MNKLFKSFLLVNIFLFYNFLSASDLLSEEQLQTPPILQSDSNAERKELVINRPLEDYLSHNEKAKLLLPCGHKVKNTTYYSCGFDGTKDIHEHTGWYTIDGDITLEPDMIGDLNNSDHLSLIFKPDTWDVIYLEMISFSHLTNNFFQKAYLSLKPNGFLIFDAHSFKKSLLVPFPFPYEDNKYIIDHFGFPFIPAVLEHYGIKKDDSKIVLKNFKSLLSLEEYLKDYFVSTLNFRDITVYADSAFDHAWISEAFKLATIELFDQARLKVYNNTRVCLPENDNKLIPLSKGYLEYPLALVQCDSSLFAFKLPDSFVILTK